MRLHVLGPLLVEGDDGANLTPRGSQQRRLLAALAMVAPRPLSVDQLGDVLWPADGPPSANALQAQISKLRRAVPGLTVTSNGGGYALHLTDRDVVDAAELERLVDQATDAAAAGRPAEALGHWRAAEALLRDHPLPELADSDLARGERARLAALGATVRVGLVDALLDSGQVDDAVTRLEQLVATDPADERWWARLMRAQYLQGRPVDALRTFRRARRYLHDELGVEPGPELRTLERQVLAHDPSLAGGSGGSGGSVGAVGAVPTASATDASTTPPTTSGPSPSAPPEPRSTVPARLTSLLGRDELLAELTVELAGARLMTLVGPGGAGKTSVALELARRPTTRQVTVVQLARLDDSGSVASEIAEALGVAAADVPLAGVGSTVTDQITDALCSKPTLLVLDNCEHLIESVAKLTHQLLESCPDLTILATSRESLGVPGELIRPVPPLPDDVAVALFVERARAVAPDLETDERTLADIRAICARLDGLPLAIELAAARVRSMDPAELLARLDDRFRVLDSGARTLEPRQQTLRAVVDWSHERLDDHEQRVFRRLAAFRGGATLAAAEAVCSDDELPAERVAGILDRLVDKSLVVRERTDGTSRYTMLQTIGEYATLQLQSSGELEHVLDRHARYYAELLQPMAQALLGREQRAAIRLISAERENVWAALDLALARGDANLALELITPLGWYFYMVAQAEMGLAALESALSCPGPTDPRLRSVALAHFGWLAANGPRLDVSLEATAEALDLLVFVDDPWLETFVHGTRIMALVFSGRVDDAQALLEPARAAADRSGDPWCTALVTLIEGAVYGVLGRADEAEEAFFEAVAGLEAVGDEFGLMIALSEAAESAEIRGDYDAAVAMLTRCIETAERVGFSSKPMAMRARLANVHTLQGDLRKAEQLHRQLLDELGHEPLPWVRTMSLLGLAVIARREGRLDEAERWLDEAWEHSRIRPVPMMRSLVRSAQGYVADLAGDAERALTLQLDGLEMATEMPNPRVLANSLEGVAGALAAGDDPDGHRTAARLLGGADRLRRGSGGPMPPGERFDVDRAERRARAALGDERFDAEFAAGAALSTDELVAEAYRTRR